jgi:hypothetical protein
VDKFRKCTTLENYLRGILDERDLPNSQVPQTNEATKLLKVIEGNLTDFGSERAFILMGKRSH